jgi:hypothetical protein
MFWWTIQIAIISFVLIFLVHHLFHFFKSTLTVPKVKDLVNGNKEEYENIKRILDDCETVEDTYSPDLFLPKIEETNQEDMKNELKHFLKSQFNTQDHESTYDNNYMSSTSLSSLPG